MEHGINKIKVKISRSVDVPVLTRCCFCIPLRKGLITVAYINLVLTGMVLPILGHYIFTHEPAREESNAHKLLSAGEGSMTAQLFIEFTSLVIEFMMTLVFLVGLHMKKVTLMKIYLYFGLVFLVFSGVYNVVLMCLSEETANEFILIVSQLVVHVYFMVLVWSSVVKMGRDGTVKYMRSDESAVTETTSTIA